MFQYIVLLAKGRSGTTWISQMLNNYPNCLYKHEPFSPSKQLPYHGWLNDLEREEIPQLRKRFDLICSRIHYEVDMPSDIGKTYNLLSNQILRLAFELGKRMTWAKRAYEWASKPASNQKLHVLIKEVGFPLEKLPRFCDVLHPVLICVVRNPFANVASALRGQQLGLFKSPRSQTETLMRQLMDLPGGQRFQQYKENLKQLPPAKFEALRWRVETELLAEFTQSYEKGRVVIYDEVCQNPLDEMEELFKFVGWEMADSTRQFILRTLQCRETQGGPEKTYYDFYQNPLESASKWKTQLNEEEKRDIASVIQDSPLKNLWKELPL